MSRASIRFRVLGPWEVIGGAGPVLVPAGRQRALLALLVVSLGRPLPVDVMGERLWPLRPPVRIPATVHTCVSRLRHLLGRDLIQTTGDGYELAVGAHQTDLWRFRDRLARAAAAGTADVEWELLRGALRLWRGRPFMGVESAWLEQAVVPGLTEEWFAAVERRIELELRRERPGAPVAELWELVRRYPTRESLWVRLMEALHRCARRADALDAYRQVRTFLAEELGIEPGDRLQAVHRRVLLDGARTGRRRGYTAGPLWLRSPGCQRRPLSVEE